MIDYMLPLYRSEGKASSLWESGVLAGSTDLWPWPSFFITIFWKRASAPAYITGILRNRKAPAGIGGGAEGGNRVSFSSDTKRELSALKPNGASEDALSLRRLFLEKGR